MRNRTASPVCPLQVEAALGVGKIDVEIGILALAWPRNDRNRSGSRASRNPRSREVFYRRGPDDHAFQALAIHRDSVTGSSAAESATSSTGYSTWSALSKRSITPKTSGTVRERLSDRMARNSTAQKIEGGGVTIRHWPNRRSETQHGHRNRQAQERLLLTALLLRYTNGFGKPSRQDSRHGRCILFRSTSCTSYAGLSHYLHTQNPQKAGITRA